MPSGRMHSDEVETSPALVAGLLAAQFPQWSGLPIRPVPSAGTVNALYRLGDRLVARLPRIDPGEQVAKETRWLPWLAPQLPLAIPQPLARGAPGAGYPWPWSVYRWLEGTEASGEHISDVQALARDLARFIAALWAIDPTDGPPPGAHNGYRGEPLANRDRPTREAIALLAEAFPAPVMTGVWETALAQPPWPGVPVWLHGDLQAGNLLAQNGRLAAVIDFGCLAVGDPASDVMAAWLYLPAGARDTFRAALAVDDATWARARGWALTVGLIALPYYEQSNPPLAAIAQQAIQATIADYQVNA